MWICSMALQRSRKRAAASVPALLLREIPSGSTPSPNGSLLQSYWCSTMPCGAALGPCSDALPGRSVMMSCWQLDCTSDRAHLKTEQQGCSITDSSLTEER